MANAPRDTVIITGPETPPPGYRTILLEVPDEHGETTLVPILVRPGSRTAAQDAALSLFWRRLLPRLDQ